MTNTTHCIIRRAQLGDLEGIYMLLEELEGDVLNFGDFKHCYLANLENSHIIYLVAIDVHDKLLGFISCHAQFLLHHAGKVFEIQELIVNKPQRGRKIGQQLLDGLENILKDEQYTSFEVTANKKRKKAREFYLKNKFIETHHKFTRPQ
ncbi:MAG: GNAT family N-acetyltransferase [Bacteroidota bacterium]